MATKNAELPKTITKNGITLYLVFGPKDTPIYVSIPEN